DPQAQKSLLTISPLVALMEEQAALLNAHGIPTVTIYSKCQNIDVLMTNLAQNRYRIAFIGPETTLGNLFGSIVLRSEDFRDACICLIIDEAHAVSEWGTDDFRPEFRELGALRSSLKLGTPVLACLATLPAAIIADIQQRLRLELDSVRVQVSNRKPNITLSVRTMQHPEDSLADLLVLIPVNATAPEDIPVTLVYVNNRVDAEAIQDFVRRHLPESIPDEVVEFYHRFIDDDDKARILQSLRCARNPTQSGEGILYVSAAYYRKCVTSLTGTNSEDTAVGPAAADALPAQGHQPALTNEGDVDGIRAETTAEELTSAVHGRTKVRNFLNVHSPCTHGFGLESLANIDATSHSQGCDNCCPREFIGNVIELDDPFKRTAGRRVQSPPDVQAAALNVLKDLRAAIVIRDWPNQSLVTGRSVMSDTVVAGLASGASFLNTMGDVEARVRWHWVPKYGQEVLTALQVMMRDSFPAMLAPPEDDIGSGPRTGQATHGDGRKMCEELKKVYLGCIERVRVLTASDGHKHASHFE
ncbi:hypothetical protein OF83DRAFT_1046893, partial [Amylostereum chailletii]